MADRPDLDRWRLVLGRFAEPSLGCPSAGEMSKRAALLDHLYGRGPAGRGVGGARGGSGASDGASQLTVPEWIRGVRDLFPSDACEVVTAHALEQFGLTELVTDPDTLASMEPNVDLLKAVLTFKGTMQGEVLDVARGVVRKVVEELREKLATEIRQALAGRRDPHARQRRGRSRDLDFRETVRRSLRHWDPAVGRLGGIDPRFTARIRRRLPWEISIVVDCSGSMLDSVIHSAVMAGIFQALPAFKVRLCAFDTQIVDLTEHVDDPVEVLMSVQLGGGTYIGRAVEYAEQRIEQPTRSMLILVTDFFEGTSPNRLVSAVKRLSGAGVRVLGLAALDAHAQPHYDHYLASECVAAGAEVAALTPEKLAEWIGRVIS